MAGALPVLLHVEDNPGDVHLLREALTESGVAHRYLVAENAVQAYNHLRLMSGGFSPALVVLDLNLPLIRGTVVLRELRAHIPWSRTAMVVLTSSATIAEHRECLAAGAAECLVKPPTFEGYLGIARRLSPYLDPATGRAASRTDAYGSGSTRASGCFCSECGRLTLL